MNAPERNGREPRAVTRAHMSAPSCAPRVRRAVAGAAAVALAGQLAGCDARDLRVERATARDAPGAAALVISEVMANPSAVPDERGEWLELYNPGPAPVSLRGYALAGGNDAPHVVRQDARVPAGGRAVLARSGDRRRNSGVDAAYAYGASPALANGADWLALRDPAGRTVDSVAWSRTPDGASRELRDPAAPRAERALVDGGRWATATARFGAGDRGTPGQPNGAAATVAGGGPPRTQDGAAAGAARDRSNAAGTAGAPAGVPPVAVGALAPLTVRVLDVGQGDAVLITNGGTTVLVDGGPDRARFGRLLDSLGLDGTTIDAVILSHAHYDHHSGLRELFRSRRRITVRYFYENADAYPNEALADLRDSVIARQRRGELRYEDTDGCAAVCTLTMRGGARLHVMRPLPGSRDANDRSTPLKLVGPDSASFTMWLAGDAEHDAIRWFEGASGFARAPGMRVDVFKADHHGSCNGVTPDYLARLGASHALVSLGDPNDYGHMHDQAKAALVQARVPWYRTDQNGTITVQTPGTPGGGYTVTVQRGTTNMRGSSDRASTQPGCRGMPAGPVAP